MAYPIVTTPYGFQPINSVDGKPYAGAIRQYPITAAYGTAIYNGDIVKLVSGGTIEKSGITDNVGAAATLGVLVGCQYVNSIDRKSTRLNSSHSQQSRMPSSA